ncbi:hypothetical protein C7M37_01636 [Lactiplantibacillus plantarum]|nr:hypothetical protein C7M37_01636 [Lactiplantibacillus plantarum]
MFINLTIDIIFENDLEVAVHQHFKVVFSAIDILKKH